jgi:flavin reductase (DIM6/NTAB) family NADH-FMN oxidoreductase RutF
MHSSSVDAFKTAFRLHPAGVAVITASTPEGPVGLTASSVASVGVDPLALAFSVTRARGSAGGILRAETFLVHLITARDVETAQAFAVSGAPRFTPEQGWTTLETGEPHLPSARYALRCRPLNITPVGDSSLVLAEVLDVIPGEDGDHVVYVDRAFRTLAPLSS